VNVFIAGALYREEFRHWVREWSVHFAGRHVPRAVRVGGPRLQEPWLHWLKIGYILKGYDRDCVVQSGRVSPDGQDVRLGGLIPFAWSDPGKVSLKKRVGVSRSLGPDRRSIGVPAGLDYLVEEPNLAPAMCRKDQGAGSRSPRMRPFRSKYEDGARDVRVLYGKEFVERVVGLPAIGLCATNDDSDLDWLVSTKI
jgi:hypothetical protein